MTFKEQGKGRLVNGTFISLAAFNAIFSEALTPQMWAKVNSDLAATGESTLKFNFTEETVFNMERMQAVKTYESINKLQSSILAMLGLQSDFNDELVNALVVVQEPTLRDLLREMSKGVGKTI